MGYIHERNYGCRVSADYTYRGLKTIIMENEKLHITILADKGTDIIEFLYKPLDVDFLWRSPLGVRNPGLNVPTIGTHIGSFLDYYEGGWQECLPNGGWAAKYKGAELGLHGEVCNIPWQFSIIEDNPERVEVKFRVRTYRTPFYLEKFLSMESNKPILHIKEKLLNEGEEGMDLMWGYHPAFGPPFLSEHCRVDVPAKKVEVCSEGAPTSRLKPGDKFAWPNCKGKDGKTVDLSRIPPASIKAADMVYLLELEEGWYAITNTKKKVGFGLHWPKEVFPYLWYWQDYQGEFGYPLYGRTYIVALEPFTSYPRFGLEEAIKRGTQMKMASGESVEVYLKAVAYEGIEGVERITENGEIKERDICRVDMRKIK
ncbi:MAG: DUF4432 family protein [Nitrospinae bacterium]|nr:DUF4432 family protein [Nitrospinota bacterium]